MNGDKSQAKAASRPRGRPRKNISDDHRLNVRREKNRSAQKLYRLRHHADKEAQRQERINRESNFDHIMTVFLSLTDRVLLSELANRDTTLMNDLRVSVQNVLSLTQQSPERGSFDALQREDFDQTIADTDSTSWFEGQSSQGDSDGPSPPSETPSTQPPELEKSPLPGDCNDPEIRQNLILNIGVPAPIASQPLTSSRCRLDNPFSLRITHLAIQHAEHLLTATTSPTDGAVFRALGSQLKLHTRQEILRNLHWHLGPGYAQLDGLATATFMQPDIFLQAKERLANKRLYNADEVAMILRQRTRGVNSDSLDVVVNVGFWPTSDVARLSGMRLPLAQSTTHPSDPEAMITIRVSKLRLLHHISKSGICLGSGPAFLGADVEQAIQNSALYNLDSNMQGSHG
ncbi:hypothetical protein EDB80DRAFT_895954 [Ilyonectria destructans]|nr:hypothetical protein EDB80DRAFT_895954 [Ilyonectria destructans]